MDLIFEPHVEEEFNSAEINVGHRPIIDYAIDFWQTFTNSAVVYYKDNNEIRSLDDDYGSIIYLLKSNPLNTEWIELVKNELFKASLFFPNKLLVKNISMEIIELNKVNVKFTYYDLSTDLISDFNIVL